MEFELEDVVRKLVGPIDPVGETREDERRYENLRNMAELVDILTSDISDVIPNKRRHEASRKKAGEFADKFLSDLGISE